jgi:hypothetical protein
MRLLADESCDFSVVRALRAAGHDVKAVVETHRGASDEDVIQLASPNSASSSPRTRTSASSCMPRQVRPEAWCSSAFPQPPALGSRRQWLSSSRNTLRSWSGAFRWSSLAAFGSRGSDQGQLWPRYPGALSTRGARVPHKTNGGWIPACAGMTATAGRGRPRAGASPAPTIQT